MLHIAICDDEKNFVQYLTDLLNQYSKETGRNIKITPYYDGILNTHAHQYSHSYGVPFVAVTVLDRCMVGFAEVFGKNSVPSEHKDMADS